MIQIIFCGKLFAQEDDNLILVVVPDFSFQDVKWLKENGNDPFLWTSGGLIGVNIRPDGPLSYLNNTVTLSSGIRGLGVENWNAVEKNESIMGVQAKELYQQLTGDVVEEGILHPYFKKLVDKNAQSTFQGKIGVLGQTLKDNNIDRFVIGNSDTQTEKVRYAPLFTMDQNGLTSGKLIEATKKVGYAPNGLLMDVDKIYQVLTERNSQYKKTFFVIEWGDIYRLYQQKNEMNQQHFNNQYAESLQRFEQFMLTLLHEQENTSVMLLSPMVNKDSYNNKELLAPLFYWNTNDLSAIYELSSSTTRQRFVGSNLDIVPTILEFFHLAQPSDLYGSSFKKERKTEAMYDEVVNKMDLIVTVYRTRGIILSGYITLLVILLLTVSGVIFVKKENARWVFIAKVLLISGISSPLWFLITPYLLTMIYPSTYLVLILLLSSLTGYVFIKYISYPVFFVNLGVFSLLTFDLLLGSPLMQRSYLGYDSIIGARFYGIGNEYAGVYIISGVLLLRHQFFRKHVALFLLAIGHLILIGSGKLGANAGATLATGIMYSYFFYRVYLKKVGIRQFTILLSVVIPILIVLLFILQLQENQTHISYAFSRLLQGDASFILETIKRKLQMNWKIFRFSKWTQLFVTTYILIGLYLWRGKRDVKVHSEHLVIQTGIVASLALLILNDSGVVAAATSMFIIVCTSYYWRLEKEGN